MDLKDYMKRAATTDNLAEDDEAIRIALFGIAGEAGSVVSEAKKWFRDGGPLPNLQDRVREELGDLLWYIMLLARRLNIDLDEVVEQNFAKNSELWLPLSSFPLPDYDNHSYANQKLIRQMKIRFEEDRSGEDRSGDIPVVRIKYEGELWERIKLELERKKSINQLGDALDDNARVDDGYRYHDIIHLAHATVLGWSPVLRGLMGAKRRDVGDYDRVEDGARAMALEEGLIAFIFNYMESYGFATDAIGWDLLKHVKRTVKDLEVSSQPFAAWKSAYTQAFNLFQEIKVKKEGVVECDLDKRELRIVE